MNGRLKTSSAVALAILLVSPAHAGFGWDTAGGGASAPSVGPVLEHDSDWDGLTNANELIYGTDPYNADTDGDGLTDSEELGMYWTDPLNPDSDNDKLSDGDEVLVHNTWPLSYNSDGDCLSDGAEIERGKDPWEPDVDYCYDLERQAMIRHQEQQAAWREAAGNTQPIIQGSTIRGTDGEQFDGSVALACGMGGYCEPIVDLEMWDVYHDPYSYYP